MKIKLFIIRDVKSETFRDPMFFANVGDATRAFQESCSDPKSAYHKYAEDFVQFYAGDLDLETGILTKLDTPMSIMTGIEASSYHKKYYAASPANLPKEAVA